MSLVLIITPLLILGLAFIVLMLMAASLIKNSKRTNCRCCGQRLHKPGGAGLVYLGRGFCRKCVAAILRDRP